MIPAYGWVAVFRDWMNIEARRVPVQAWDEDGHAMVADRESGRLCRANEYGDFAHLETVEQREEPVAPRGSVNPPATDKQKKYLDDLRRKDADQFRAACREVFAREGMMIEDLDVVDAKKLLSRLLRAF